MGFIYCSSPSQVALQDSKTSPRPASARLPSRDGSPSLALFSLFLSFMFVLPPFEDNGLLFWAADDLS